MDETSAGVILYLPGTPRLYLLLHYGGPGHWDFAKGGVEEGETEMDTALRETLEETGIGEPRLVEGFREQIDYHYKRKGRPVHKRVIFFLAESPTDQVTLSEEHQGYLWLPPEEAVRRATYDNAKNLVRRAEEYLAAR